MALANRNPDVTVRLDGGYDQAERRRVIIGPDYRSLDDEAMGICVLVVNGPGQAQLELDHGDFLGALLGLGIKRDRIGDIHVHEHFCHIVVMDEIADYLNIQLRQVHRINVLTDVVSLAELKIVVPKLEEMNLSVASMRLDGIASDVYRISRSKIVDPIRAGRCRVNWKSEEDPSKQLRGEMWCRSRGLAVLKCWRWME